MLLVHLKKRVVIDPGCCSVSDGALYQFSWPIDVNDKLPKPLPSSFGLPGPLKRANLSNSYPFLTPLSSRLPLDPEFLDFLAVSRHCGPSHS
jgi:hypothetical protein